MISFLIPPTAGAVATIAVAPLQNPVWVSPGDKAVLPVSLQLLNPTWDFYHLKWSFLTGDRPVLVYTMERCNQTLAMSGQQCQHRMEVGDFYKPRANISYNASLVLQDARPDDAGVYQLTVQGLDETHTTQVTLILQGNDGFGRGGPPNPKRWRGVTSKRQVCKAQGKGFSREQVLAEPAQNAKNNDNLKQLVLLRQKLY